MDINIAKSSLLLAPHKRWRGAGMVSGNNSSRLLLDYRAEHPEAYEEILRHIFTEEGLNVTHLKLEMGSDINSTSGTEPSVMRAQDEPADVTRGAGYRLAADAKTLRPDLTLDMLFWSDPRWVTDASDVYAARYAWYKETLCAAYHTYGLRFDYVSANRNERAIDADWIIYLNRRLKAETDAPYDFSTIGIVAADEDNAWHIAEQMMDNSALRDAVDVIGSHYTSHSTEAARHLCDHYNKALWFSEGCPPMSYSEGTRRFDGNGLAGINGILDIATRIIGMVSLGGMTLYEYQPVVSAYYDGVTFCHKQLITANEPWSGHYTLDPGYYMALHFSRFLRPGWAIVADACACNGEKGGDGHALVNTTKSILTLADPATGDYSSVIVNSTDEPQTYTFHVSDFPGLSNSVYVWETYGTRDEVLDAHYMKRIDTLYPTCDSDGSWTYSVTIRPASLVTITTLNVSEDILPRTCSDSRVLSLPYEDDFAYCSYEADHLASRGYAPHYTTDQGGAFEVETTPSALSDSQQSGGLPETSSEPSHMIVQQILPETKAEEWGYTPLPYTDLGDDRWYDYGASISVKLTQSNVPSENYSGIAIRHYGANGGISGYALLLYEDGSWRFHRNHTIVHQGTFLASADTCDPTTAFYRLCLIARDDNVRGYINDVPVVNYHAREQQDAVLSAGRVALYSSYNRNAFARLRVFSEEDVLPYIERMDDTEHVFSYNGTWTHNLMGSFKDYRRTVSVGEVGSSVTFFFERTGFGIFGKNEGGSVLRIELDGSCICPNYDVPNTEHRELFFSMSDLPDTMHTLTLTIISGTLSVDGAQITQNKK